MALSYTDYYEVLGVPHDADQDAIRRAYRKLARQYHPDLNHDDGAEERFKEIGEAYEVLSDPEKRGRYERAGEEWRSARTAEPGISFDDLYQAQTAGPGGAPFGQEASDRGDLFEALFGHRAARPGGPLRGHDRHAQLELSLEDAQEGGRRRLTIDGADVTVNFPAGVRDGQLIRVPGKGGEGRGGGSAGDLFLRVVLAPHPELRRRGESDLEVDAEVTPADAALGATVEVPTPTGHARIRVPPGSSSGRMLRLRERGLPTAGGATGDLYAVVKIVVPQELTDRERELYEQLAALAGGEPEEEAP